LKVCSGRVGNIGRKNLVDGLTEQFVELLAIGRYVENLFAAETKCRVVVFSSRMLDKEQGGADGDIGWQM